MNAAHLSYIISVMTPIKKPKFVLLTCLLPFLVTKGSRVLEKNVNETEVSKTVFSHLKAFGCGTELLLEVLRG